MSDCENLAEKIYIAAENLGIELVNDHIGVYSYEFETSPFFNKLKEGASISLSETSSSLLITLNEPISDIPAPVFCRTPSVPFTSMLAGNNIVMTEVDGQVTISAAGDLIGGVNLGSSGARVYVTENAGQLQFRRLVAGANVSITENVNDIVISSVGGAGGGTIVGAANLGTTTYGIYANTVDGILNFKSLLAGSNVTLSASSTGITINSLSDITNAANLGASGSSLFSGKVGGILNFRKIVAGSNITVTENTNDITIASTATGGGGLVNTAANLVGGTGLYASTTVDTLNFKSLVAGTNTSITNDANTVTINSVSDVTNGTNLGVTGSRVFSAKSAGVLQFRRLIAGTNVTITENTNDITISATGGVGGGDMYKATYDADNDGIVDNSEQLGSQLPAYYLSRANHTGTQAASTITGLATVATTGLYSSLSGTPTIPTLLNDFTDVTISGVTSGQVLQYNGSQWINATVSGGSSTIETKVLSFASGLITIRASGSSTDLALVTAVKDFSTASRSTVIVTKPSAVVIQSVHVVFLDTETAGRTEVALECPDSNNATDAHTAQRPLAVRFVYNSGNYTVGATTSTFAYVNGSVFRTLLTSYTGSAFQRASFTF